MPKIVTLHHNEIKSQNKSQNVDKYFCNKKIYNKREKRKKHSNIKKLKYNILLTIKSHYYSKSRNDDSMVINIYI